MREKLQINWKLYQLKINGKGTDHLKEIKTCILPKKVMKQGNILFWNVTSFNNSCLELCIR